MMIGRGGGGGSHHRRPRGLHVVDLCCGVGFSTRALRDAFPQTDTTVIGVDTSPQMVNHRAVDFSCGCCFWCIRYRQLTFTQ
jgi:trans-aconitate methyltransferase